ncbi:MAG TPA: hypothetical protein VJ385_03115 [Fibrobacteria bacterium]|nr:hypothetical protein [Fibrobacteria bacterium]
MLPSLPLKTTWAALMGATLFLGACVTSNDEPAAIDPEFANAKIDARVAGRSLMSGFEMGKDWNSTVTAPAGLQLLGGVSATVGVLKKSSALPKPSADVDLGGSLHANLDDTAKGYATIYAEYKLLLSNVKDTAVVKWDDKARDTVKDNENVISFKRVSASASLGGKVETAEFTDGDGDGIVTAVPGKANKVRLAITVEENGSVEKTTLLVGAGPDANFDLEGDNTVLEASWVRTGKNGAVTATGAYLDADGDGVITDNSKTCVVLAKYSEIEPKDRPLIEKADFEAKVRVFAAKAGDEPVSFSYRETTKLGRVNAVSFKNRAGGAEIVKGDTMTVHLETTVSASEDTLKHAAIDFVMNPGQDLKSDSDDVCYAIHIAARKKLGLEREAEFHFISATGIPHGQEPVSGSFHGFAKYANGQSAGLKGTFSPSGFSAEFTGPEGNTITVEYAKNGDVVATP